MKKIILLLLAVAMFSIAQASTDEKEITSEIDAVTVFTNKAQITRLASRQLAPGSYTLRFTGLSPSIDGNSVRVKGTGNLMVMSVRYKENPAKTIEYPKRVKKLQQLVDDINQAIQDERTWIGVLNEEERYIKTNTDMINEHVLAKPEEVKDMHNYYRLKIKEIRFENLKRTRHIQELTDSLTNVQNRIRSLSSEKQDASGEIFVEVSVSNYTTAKFELSYLINGAGWYPTYDIRVDDVNKPVQLAYKANIFQSTGVSWKNIELTLSNADPGKSGQMPQLSPYYIQQQSYRQQQVNRFTNHNGSYNSAIRNVSGYVRDASTGEPIPFATVRVGTNGTSSDANGFFSIDIPENQRYLNFSYTGYGSVNLNVSSSNMNAFLSPSAQQLASVQVAESRSYNDMESLGKSKRLEQQKSFKEPKITINRQSTSMEFKLEGRHNIDNTGKTKSIGFREEEISSEFEYQCVPKLDEHAYLFARVSGWEDLDLINGKVNIFFNNTIVGETFFNLSQMKDTLDISLGQDQDIFVSRKKLRDYSKKQILSNNVKVSRKFEIKLRNNKNTGITLKVFDQIPVSRINDIDVEHEGLDNAKLNENYGFAEWTILLDKHETKKIEFGYTVKYPKHMRLSIQ